MKMANRDWIILVVIILLFGFLIMGKGKLKAVVVPDNEKHSSFYEAMNKSVDRVEVEKGCATCHGIKGISLSEGHPPKEQCLICHKLARQGKR